MLKRLHFKESSGIVALHGLSLLEGFRLTGMSVHMTNLHEKIVTGKEVPSVAAFAKAHPDIAKHLEGDKTSLFTQEAHARLMAFPLHQAEKSPHDNLASVIHIGPSGIDRTAARVKLGLEPHPQSIQAATHHNAPNPETQDDLVVA